MDRDVGRDEEKSESAAQNRAISVRVGMVNPIIVYRSRVGELIRGD
jgi:hypothetical protein